MGSQISSELWKQDDLVARMETADMEYIGKGRFGKVFKCIERGRRKTASVFAVKVLTADLRDTAAESRCECKSLCRNSHVDNHERLVETFACTVTVRGVYVGMEFCDGGSLHQLVHNRGVLDEANTRKLTSQVLQGLFHLHEHNIIHGDLHPGNVLLDSQGDAKLTDFGLYACLASSGAPLGMPGFVAPELRQRGGITPLADVWSTGALVLFMVTGKPPSSNHDGAQALPPASDSLALRRFVTHSLLPLAFRPPTYWLLRYSFLLGVDSQTDAESSWITKLQAAPNTATAYQSGASTETAASQSPNLSAETTDIISGLADDLNGNEREFGEITENSALLQNGST